MTPLSVAVGQSTAQQATTLLAQIAGLAILAGAIALVAAFAYRWYVREGIPWGLAVLLGLSGVATLLNTTSVLGEVIGGNGAATGIQEALFNIAAFAVGVGGAIAGRRIGDAVAVDVFEETGAVAVDDGIGRLVKAVGRVITVELPEELDDAVGYDPVSPATRDALAGRRFLFPRGLTVRELHDRLVARLKTDYAVGHVDLELAADGTVEHLGLGSRAAGIGPTLPPATNAVAIRADPAFAASAGDLVQVWETDPLQRVLTAELRGVADDVVTVAIDAADTPKLDPDTEYRLVTLPVEDRPEREFASLLRAADETHTAVTVAAGSPLDGLAVGALDVTVIAVTTPDESPAALPDATHVIRAGDVVNAIARPEALRRLEAAAAAGREPEPSADPAPAEGVAETPSISEGDEFEGPAEGASNPDDEPGAIDPTESEAEPPASGDEDDSGSDEGDGPGTDGEDGPGTVDEDGPGTDGEEVPGTADEEAAGTEEETGVEADHGDGDDPVEADPDRRDE